MVGGSAQGRQGKPLACLLGRKGVGSLFPIERLCGEAHMGRHRLDAFLCGLGSYQAWRDGIGVDVGSLQFRSQTAGKLPLGGFKDLEEVSRMGARRLTA